MIRRWIIKKSKGELATFTMVYVLLFFTATVAFALQIRQYISLKTYTEDALAASNLASAVIDIQEYGVNHNLIIKEAMTYIRQFVEFNPSMLFELLPRKFTAAQLRTLFELVYDKAVDVRNFHKKIAMMEYVVPLEEKQQGVAHRAARYYKFDKKIYNKVRR